MVWPQCLSTVALFIGFHESKQDLNSNSTYSMTRYHCFWLALIGMFIYSWFPLYISPILQSISVLCFITNIKSIHFLASALPPRGVGLGAFSLDWSQIGGGFLTSPWWATVNIMTGNIIWGWILSPILFYTNAFGMDQSLNVNGEPTLNTGSLFNRNGTQLAAVSLYNTTTFDLNEEAYQKQSPIYITSFFAMAYASRFLSIAAAFTHVFLWYGKDIQNQFRAALHQMEDDSSQDIHNKLMKRYPDISEYSYLIFLSVMTLIQIVVSATTSFTMPIWAVFLCLVMSLTSILPIGVISAVSGTQLALNVLTEFIIGLLIPGKTIAVMTFKSLGTNSVIQALDLLSDLKLGHYSKIL